MYSPAALRDKNTHMNINGSMYMYVFIYICTYCAYQYKEVSGGLRRDGRWSSCEKVGTLLDIFYKGGQGMSGMPGMNIDCTYTICRMCCEDLTKQKQYGENIFSMKP
jgi:hypothetical protein